MFIDKTPSYAPIQLDWTAECPEKVMHVGVTLPPRDVVGPKSGAYAAAQLLDTLKF